MPEIAPPPLPASRALTKRARDGSHPIDADASGRPIWGRNAKGQAICFAKSRRSPTGRCRQTRLLPNGRCRMHPGAPSGPANPAWKGGLHSDLFKPGTPLGDGYRMLQRDDDYLSLREQMRLLAGREREVAVRISQGTGESGRGWRLAQEAYARLAAAWATKPPTEASVAMLGQAMRDLDGLLRQGQALEANHAELREIAALRARLVDAEGKILERGQALYTADQVLHMMGVLTAHAMRAITDAKRSAEFINVLRAIVAGREVGSEVADVLQLPAGRG